MQQANDNKISISSSVHAIQNLFRNLEKQWPVLKKDKANTGNELHALGPVNLNEARQEFANHVNAIRSICSQFETEVLGDVMKMGAGADPAFRKHFTHLKEQAMLETTVIRVTETLKSAKDRLEQALNERESSIAKVLTQKLEKLAESMGLMAFVDASQKNEAGIPVTTITLGGKAIVVDIDMDDRGEILRCNVTYVPDELRTEQDARVDRLLAQNLRSRDFKCLERNLGALALLDHLSVAHKPANFFLFMKGLLEDQKSIYQQEMVLLSGNIASVLMEGHGVPCQHFDYPGLSVAYWIKKELVLGNNWEAVKDCIEKDENHPSLLKADRLLISFENSQQPQHFLPPSRTNYLLSFEETEDSIKEGENGDHLSVVRETARPKFMQPLRFIKVQSTYPNLDRVPIRFVAKLDPPVAASDATVRKLMIATGLAGVDLANMTVENVSSTSTRSLEELLIPSSDDGERRRLDPDETWAVTYDDTPEQAYKWMGTSKTGGKVISRVPFTHPCELYAILKHLRQQQMFNTLFKSIFNEKATRRTNDKKQVLSLDEILQESQSDKRLHIRVASIDAPRALHLTITLPPTAHSNRLLLLSLSIEIPKDVPARPVVKLNLPAADGHDPMHQLMWHPEVFDEDKMSRVIQTGYNIPLLIRWLWKRIERHSEDYVVQTPRLSSRRSRPDDESYMQDKRIKTESQDA